MAVIHTISGSGVYHGCVVVQSPLALVDDKSKDCTPAVTQPSPSEVDLKYDTRFGCPPCSPVTP